MRKIKRNIWRKKREKEGKADIVESHRQAAIKQEIKKRSRERQRERGKVQRTIRRQQVCMLFFELANVEGTLCGFQQSVLRQVDDWKFLVIKAIKPVSAKLPSSKTILEILHTIKLTFCT